MKKIKKFMRRSWVVLLLLCCLNVVINMEVINAQNEETINIFETENVAQGKDLYFKGRKMFYNAENTPDQARATLALSKESFAKLSEGDLKCYWLAQVEFTLAEIDERTGNKKEAAMEFSKSNDLVKKAINYNEKLSDAYRLLADTYMRLMDYNGPLYSVNHGPQALRLTKKAFQLDNQNFTALNSSGVYYVSAPKAGGGNINKGIADLEKALASNDPFDKFIAHVWLGTAYQKKGNKTEALNHFDRALKIYPNSPWAKGLASQCNQTN